MFSWDSVAVGRRGQCCHLAAQFFGGTLRGLEQVCTFVSLFGVDDRVQHDFVIVKVAVFSQAQVTVEDDANGQSGLRWISLVFTGIRIW